MPDEDDFYRFLTFSSASGRVSERVGKEVLHIEHRRLYEVTWTPMPARRCEIGGGG